MVPKLHLAAWRNPPLAMQIIALLVGGLLIAQFVILLLTILLPPAPPPTYELGDIATVLRSGSRANLARLMHRSPDEVRLYAQPGDSAPAFSQSVAPRAPPRPAQMPVMEGGRPGDGRFAPPRIIRAAPPMPHFDDPVMQSFAGDAFRLPAAAPAPPRPDRVAMPETNHVEVEARAATIAPAAPAAIESAPQAPPAGRTRPPATAPTVDRDGVPIARSPQVGLFGLASQPYIQGDFVAALRLGPSRWAIVQPAAEPFPNTWQRRVLLWFLVSLAVVVPLGLFFARRLARPLASFADAAEQLGRDPSGPIIALDGPAEIGRAADAFNRMQGRLKSFVADRTAMMGAISHDLRNPLTRLRFRIEEVDDALRDGMIGEVAEMETMIGSVLDFLRDAADPGIRHRIDLRSLVETAVDDAAFVGKDVELDDAVRAPVSVDALAIKRTLANLIDNAVKYGRQARISLTIEGDDALVDIRDRGPGLGDDEMERIFEPFYRTEASRASGKAGIGLGLSVCRSIARARGGDVMVIRCEEGLIARLRVPLINPATRKTAPHIAKLQA